MNKIKDVIRPSTQASFALSQPFIAKSLGLHRFGVARWLRHSRGLSVLRVVTMVLLLAVMDIAAALDINVADATQIADGLKGVGLKKAQAIVDYRKANGRFASLDDLMKVKGVGKKILEINASNISFSSDNSASSQ